MANTSWYLFNFRENTLREFVQRGYDVHVLAGDRRYEDELRKIGVKFHFIKFRSDGMNLRAEVKNIYSMCLYFVKIWPVVTFSFTPKANIYAALFFGLARKRIVINVSGLGRGINLRPRIMRRLVLWLYRISMSLASFVYFQNRDDYLRFVGRSRLPESKARLLPGSGIPLERFCYEAPSGRDRPIVFGMASRLIVEKGVRVFLEVASRFSGRGDVIFRLAGELEGGTSAITREEINEAVLAGYIEYVGFITSMPQFWRECDVAVLPSSYPEGTPRSLIEAGAMGKILVTTDSPGCRECVTNKAGYLVERDSAESLYEGIQAVLALDESDLRTMGRDTSEFIRAKFDERLVIEEYLRIAAKLTAQYVTSSA